jgi:hypothetical protein
MSNPPQEVTLRLLDQYGDYIDSRIPRDRRQRMMMRMPPQPIAPAQLDAELVFNILTQADLGNPLLLMSLYEQILFSDNHIQGELGKRQLAVLGDPISVLPRDPKRADDVKAAAFCKQQIDDCPTWFGGVAHLLKGTIWPVALTERIYKTSATPGVRFDLADMIPVRMELLYFDARGPLRIWDVDPETHSITATNQCVDPMRYVLHRGHLLGDQDHRGGPLRSLVFWWLFSGYNRDWWVRFIDKYGSPFMVGKYDQDDDDSRLVLQQAFALATKLGGIVISNETSVEIQQAMSESAGKAFDNFHSICQQEKSKLIVGQTTSASGRDAGGLSSGGVADAQENVRSDIRQFDKLSLGETVRHQVCRPLLDYNGMPGDVSVTWGGEKVEDSETTGRTLGSLNTAGLELTDEGITAFSERFGLPLRRKALSGPISGQPAPGNPLTTLDARTRILDPHLLAADLANDRIAAAGAPGLARALRDDLAPVLRILRESASPADFEARLRSEFPAWSPSRALPLIEAGLTAFTVNAL